jgi:hypothetical protein
MESADDAALKDRPETFNRIGVDRADNVLASGVVDSGVGIALLAQMAVANPLIGAKQANLFRHSFFDESFQGGRFDVRDNASNHVAFALHSADHDCLSRGRAARQAIALVPMAVVSLAADERLVDLDNAAKLGFRFDQGGADFVAHEPSSFDRTETHVAAKLASAHALFAGEDQVRNLEPVAERFVGVLENCPCDAGEAVAIGRTFTALPMEAFIRGRIVEVRIAAARAFNAIGPAAGDQISLASLIVADWKHGVELGRSKLVDWLWAAGGFHGFPLSMGRI